MPAIPHSQQVQIVYETHATTEDNEQGIATGWLPGRLSTTGRRQAEELGQRRRDDGIAAVYVSDLARAVDTAHIAFGSTDLRVIRDPRLRECNYGELNGKPVTRLEAERPRHLDEPFPGGESYDDVVSRMADLLEDLRQTWLGQRVLLIGHAAPRWALDHLINGESLEDLVGSPFDRQPGWEYVLRVDTPLHGRHG